MACYRRTYLCVCEGQQEEMYLKHVAKLITDFPNRVIHFNTIVGNPDRMRKTLVDYDKVALFDHDFNDVGFRQSIELCDRLDKTGRATRQRSRTYHAFSNLNFDLWLILHKEDFGRPISRNDAYQPEVRRIYGLGSTDDIKSKELIQAILRQIALNDIKNAIRRAERLRSQKIVSDGVIIGSTRCYPNPDLSIHAFMQAVLADCGQF